MTNRRSTPTTPTPPQTPQTTAFISRLSRSRRRKRFAAERVESLSESFGREVGHFIAMCLGRPRVGLSRQIEAEIATGEKSLRLIHPSVFAQVARVAPDLPIVKRVLRRSSIGTVVTIMVGAGVMVWTGRKLSVTDLVKELAKPVILQAVHGATRLAVPLLVADLIVSALVLAGNLPQRRQVKA